MHVFVEEALSCHSLLTLQCCHVTNPCGTNNGKGTPLAVILMLQVGIEQTSWTRL